MVAAWSDRRRTVDRSAVVTPLALGAGAIEGIGPAPLIAPAQAPALAQIESWLRQAQADPSLQVERLDWTPVAGGQLAGTWRLRVSLVGRPAWPLVCKLPSANPATRAAVTAMGLYRTEVEAYRHADLLAAADMPRCLHADGQGLDGSFVLLLEDLAPARQVSHHSVCAQGDLESALRTAAALHHSARDQFDSAVPPFLLDKQRREVQNLRLLPMAVQRFKALHGPVLTAQDLALVDQLVRVYPRAIQFRGPELTLLHGDFRLQNLLFDIRGQPGRVGVLDWQTLRLGHGLADVASLLGGSLEPALRRDIERDLLGAYSRALAQWGEPPMDADEVWLGYRKWAVYALGSTLLSIVLMQDGTQSDDFLVLMKRHLRQVADLDSMTLWTNSR